MTVSDSWRALAETAARRGLPLEEALRPPVSPAKLDKAERKLSISFHPDLRELFGQVDGLKRLRGHRRDPRLPGFNFPSLKEATDRTLRLRDVAETVDSIELWRQHWVKVFDDDYEEVFAVDCSDGSVWYAWWEASEIHQVAPDLATFFDMAAAAADGDDVHYRLDGDYFETPDGEVWRAPIKRPWSPT
ncbi:SMI1/KNR4 family protein [Propionicimonas sp.]|uniref:SMI1/KNR4 family protein n=1 Tax=Propionicimonas sp. TaxID=1955623 RepID=UPI0039E6203A